MAKAPYGLINRGKFLLHMSQTMIKTALFSQLLKRALNRRGSLALGNPAKALPSQTRPESPKRDGAKSHDLENHICRKENERLREKMRIISRASNSPVLLGTKISQNLEEFLDANEYKKKG